MLLTTRSEGVIHLFTHLYVPHSPLTTDSVQQMLLEEYEGTQGALPGSLLSQGQLRLQHATPLGEPAAVEGPFDVVVADADAGLLLHGLIAAEPGT